MPFPILRAPFVVLSEIFCLLEPYETVTASFCSQNFKCLLRNHYRQRKPLMWETFMRKLENKSQIAIVAPGIETSGTLLSVLHISKVNEAMCDVIEINGYKIEFSSEFITLYIEDQVLGSKWIVEYITDLFNIDIRMLAIDRYNTWAIDWINKRQKKPLDRFGLIKPANNDSNADETLEYVLKNARSSDLLGIDEYISDNFRFNGKLGPVNELYLTPNGFWVTFDNLMNFDATNIYISRSRLTVSDLNLFLRHWRAGGSQRLQYLEVGLEERPVFQNFFDEDLEAVRTNEKGIYAAGYGEVRVRKCYSIQRMDGIRALVRCKRRRQRFYMIVQHETASN